jgi:uncharacterized protein YneF (UPF0154 family)
MPALLSMAARGDARGMEELAKTAGTFFGKVAGAMEAERLEKVARFFGPMKSLRNEPEGDEVAFLAGGPVSMNIGDYLRDHPPTNMDALRDLYAQATERALQKFLAKMETSEDADPMGLALKNLQRMSDILNTRLDIMRAQKELSEFQQDMAEKQGLSQTNPAAAAAQQLPGPVGLPAPEGAPPGGAAPPEVPPESPPAEAPSGGGPPAAPAK